MSQSYSFLRLAPRESLEGRWALRGNGTRHGYTSSKNGRSSHAAGNGTGQLRLLFISHSFPPAGSPMENVGGMQRVATELHSALGMHPGVQMTSRLLETSWKMTHLRVVPFCASLLRNVPRIVREQNIDVVLFSSMVTAVLVRRLKASLADTGVTMAAIVHGRDITLPVSPYQYYLRHVFAALDLVLPVSRATAEECLKRGVSPSRIRIIPNGININRFTPLSDKKLMRQELNAVLGDSENHIPEDALLLCSAGRHVERKGFGWFVENVMPLLSEDVHFWLAGDGPMSDSIRALAEQKGLGKRVRLLGRITDAALEALYRGSDIFVMPNIPVEGDLEGFGVVMLEAGLNGLPTIASKLEGIQDVVCDGKNGYLVRSGDPWSFFEVIQYYYENRDALSADSIRSAEFTQNNFMWHSVADRYYKILREYASVPAPSTEEAVLV